jgi:hypothetical protein
MVETIDNLDDEKCYKEGFQLFSTNVFYKCIQDWSKQIQDHICLDKPIAPMLNQEQLQPLIDTYRLYQPQTSHESIYGNANEYHLKNEFGKSAPPDLNPIPTGNQDKHINTYHRKRLCQNSQKSTVQRC